jgi:hypothetical protein
MEWVVRWYCLGNWRVSRERATASREESARVRLAWWADETLLPAKDEPGAGASEQAGRMGQQSLEAETDRVLLRAYEHPDIIAITTADSLSVSPTPVLLACLLSHIDAHRKNVDA